MSKGSEGKSVMCLPLRVGGWSWGLRLEQGAEAR